MSLPELIVFFLVVFLLFRPMQAAWLFVRPPRLRVAYRSPEEWGAAYETVQLTTADGTQLVGWYLPSRNGAAILPAGRWPGGAGSRRSKAEKSRLRTKSRKSRS